LRNRRNYLAQTTFLGCFFRSDTRVTIHFEDYTAMSSLPCPDGSQLDADGAILFSEALVKLLRETILALWN
jgi:hypothetical protein